jgi:hypothetical protein
MAEKKRKTLSIVLAGILVVFLGVKGILYFRGSQETSKAKESLMAKLTQDNPAAGIVIIGSALKQYHQTIGRYPQNLKELYPKYIPEAQVVNQAAWRYNTDGNTHFILERAVARQGTTLVYRIDPALKLAKEKSDKKHIMVASAGHEMERQGPTQGIILASAVQTKETASVDEKLIQQQDETQNNLNEGSPRNVKKPTTPWTSAESTGVQIPRHYKEIAQNLQLSSLLVWVNSKETLCFSNVQYSEPAHIKAINSSNTWLVLRHHGG